VYDPVIGILMSFGAAIAFIAITYYHFARTDEHDRIIHLWSFTWGFLTYCVIVPAWWILTQSGLLGPVNYQHVFVISAIVVSIVWAWLRFR